MDEQLAAIYGTGQPEVTENDMEKAAAAELLVKLAEDEGVDLNQFSDEEIADMVTELYGDQSGQEKTAEEEKIAEADYLGRVMAHSYVQELDNIEKEAAGRVRAAAGKVGDAAKAVGRWFKGRPGQYREAGREVKEVLTGKGHQGTGNMDKMDRLRSLLSAAKRTAPETATAAGLTAAGIGAHKYRHRND